MPWKVTLATPQVKRYTPATWEVVAGRRVGRVSEDEVVVFDSSGTALQDVAAAATVYERAVASRSGLTVELGLAPRTAMGTNKL
jgi:ornithine cyclodeaminase/alanine dehydrogenase-like protein (mu-crystallin family)